MAKKQEGRKRSGRRSVKDIVNEAANAAQEITPEETARRAAVAELCASLALDYRVVFGEDLDPAKIHMHDDAPADAEVRVFPEGLLFTSGVKRGHHRKVDMDAVCEQRDWIIEQGLTLLGYSTDAAEKAAVEKIRQIHSEAAVRIAKAVDEAKSDVDKAYNAKYSSRDDKYRATKRAHVGAFRAHKAAVIAIDEKIAGVIAALPATTSESRDQARQLILVGCSLMLRLNQWGEVTFEGTSMQATVEGVPGIGVMDVIPASVRHRPEDGKLYPCLVRRVSFKQKGRGCDPDREVVFFKALLFPATAGDAVTPPPTQAEPFLIVAEHWPVIGVGGKRSWQAMEPDSGKSVYWDGRFEIPPDYRCLPRLCRGIESHSNLQTQPYVPHTASVAASSEPDAQAHDAVTQTEVAAEETQQDSLALALRPAVVLEWDEFQLGVGAPLKWTDVLGPLGIHIGLKREQFMRKRRALMRDYHTDKFDHLPEEQQVMARARALKFEAALNAAKQWWDDEKARSENKDTSDEVDESAPDDESDDGETIAD